ncbi:hypothetical protein PYW08_001209 [Mythimna loreyi]|uniref:Uncharacterized protein n=1 Tax=Mythimna loreyi TaxID=667449 RepID=A0ACC2R090_9NEOP|nr:hypothetical protein PYW08_001209 [Mythimna loreyi]
MSFITKRERVFNEYDLYDLPARNEGKLKAYASCTDARAWSHFCSDKSEHLVDVIKRNNEIVRPKYLPTEVIVDTLMVAKNAEIQRLKRKIEEFEQMMSAYDQLELSCDQKCEIASAHAAIKEANKELDELFADLDLSDFTEGKSRGDEDHSIGVQKDPCTCDVATLARDPRITEMQDEIITKDAKLNAMKNTIAVMENEVCEPYCIYAHIYTALEKIFGILCQNDKYRQYLKLMTAGKDVRCIDIKGKILFKLKVLEKFSCALIAPCTQEFIGYPNKSSEDCACYRVDVSESRQPMAAFALSTPESKKPNLDSKRAQLVADIIQNDEMKLILSKDSAEIDEEEPKDEVLIVDNHYHIDKENLNRLKSLQENYNELMTCYETLKHEKDELEKRCKNYDEMELEYENLKERMHEYNSLWNEKEHFKKRSADLDSLKEQYLVLTDETSNLETQLKAESEINHIKCKALDSLRSENITLTKQLNDASISYEKEKNTLMCKLKEADCRIMCQEQQIKTLLQQIDELLEQDQGRMYSRGPETNELALLDEIESSKELIKSLRDALLCNEEEKQDIQKHYQHDLELINELKLEIEDWKSLYEKTLQRNDYLEKYNESLLDESRSSQQDFEEKTKAVENLMNVIKNKSQEINKLIQDVENEKEQNKNLCKQLNELRDRFDSSRVSLENEKLQALQSLDVARQESQELLNKVKDYDEVIHKKDDVTKSLEQQLKDNKELQDLLMATIEENRELKKDLDSRENHNTILVAEIQRLRDINEYAVESINSLEDQNNQYKMSLDLTLKESGELKDKMLNYENLSLQLQNLQSSHEKLVNEKTLLQNELLENSYELENAKHSIELSKRESEEIIDKLQQSQGSKDNEISRIREAYQKLSGEKYIVQKALMEKTRDMDDLLQALNNLKLENDKLLQACGQSDGLEQELESLRNAFAELSNERNILEQNKTEEFNHLYNTLEKKIEENRELMEHIKTLESNQAAAENTIETLQSEKMMTENKLNVMKKESLELVDKIKDYENLENEYAKLKNALDQMAGEKENLQAELNRQLAELGKIERENSELQSTSQILLTHSEDLESALVDARSQLIQKSSDSTEPFKDIMDEIAVMREEKVQNQNKIRDLLDQQEYAESVMCSLRDEVAVRDSKIATLQNHINKLEEEVFRLHNNLDEVISCGEEMKDFSLDKINALQKIEAHHSRATHNMKMELAKLENENLMLSEQISATKMKSDESLRHKVQFASQLKHLLNEREQIITEIKQLELESVGDSALVTNDCNGEDILASLDRIRDSFKTRTSKSSSLERTLLKVQTSSQLLLSKADEAKKIVEREKQKIISEKEEAIIEKQNMETKLLDLKTKLEKQIANDKEVIENLEATIKNQKLITDRINKSTQDYITKLKEELQTLKDLYKNSVEKIGELQEKLQNTTENNSHLLITVGEITENLLKKSNEVAELQNELEALKSKKKMHRNVESQVELNHSYQNTESQAEMGNLPTESKKMQTAESFTIMKNAKEKNVDELPLDKKQYQRFVNEVDAEVDAAAVELPFDVVKNSYVDYKMKLLSTGRLEQHSITCLTEDESNENIGSLRSLSEKPFKSKGKLANASAKVNNLIDIYNRQSIDTTSSRGNDESENVTNNKATSQSEEKTTEYPEVHQSYQTDSTTNYQTIKDSKTFEGASSDKSTDKDLFVIYKDSDSSYNNNKEKLKGPWSSKKGHPDIVVEAVTVHPTKKGLVSGMSRRRRMIDDDTYALQQNDNEGSSGKHKLKIDIPRVITDSASVVTTSDIDKKSLDSYTLALYSSPKRYSETDTKFKEGLDGKTIMVSLPTISDENNQYLGSYSLSMGSDEDAETARNQLRRAFGTDSDILQQKHLQIPSKRATTSTPYKNESHHKLSRVGADVLLLKAEQDKKNAQMRQNFGLEYILDTVDGEVSPGVENYFTKEMRKTKSAERLNSLNLERYPDSPSRLSGYKMFFTDYNTYSSKTSNKSPPKSFTERSIMAKLDINKDYEIQIHTLTRALENIEKDYKKKIEAIKMQYDSNIKSIINEHNQGVKSIQSLHEETLQDMIKLHESEVENLRAMSMEAMKKADKLEKENRALKSKVSTVEPLGLDVEPVKIASPDITMRKKGRDETRMLTKTTVEAFNVKPKKTLSGPCTCSLDVNVSDTIRNIFEQVDVEQRKVAEHTYLKYIATKILNGNLEGGAKLDLLQSLDAQELSFLHFKVCRTWKTKLTKEEALQKRIDSLENELINKQRNAQQHIADLDRKVAEERRHLQEVREAVCRKSSAHSRPPNSKTEVPLIQPPPIAPSVSAEKDPSVCNVQVLKVEAACMPSAGDIVAPHSTVVRPPRRARVDCHRASLAKADGEERREKKPTYNEPPTRLRRSHDRQPLRSAHKK